MPLEIRPSGIPGLDIVLGGGLPRGSVLMIAGAPGTGKTILALQFCFRWIGLSDPALSARLQDWRANQTAGVATDPE